MQSAVRIFSPRAELFNLALAPLFLAVAFTQGGLHFFRFGPEQATWALWFASYVGLNLVHNAFSLSLLYTPEVRAWIREQSLHRGRNILVGWVAAAFLLLLYFQFRAWYGPDSHWIVKHLFALEWAMIVGHGLFQFFGLSVLYNRKSLAVENFPEPAKARFLAIEGWERKLHKSFCVISSLVFGYAFVFQSLPYFSLWVGLILLLVLALNALAWLYPGAGRSNKRWFQLRLFLMPLALFSSWGFVGLAVTHGIEYTLLYSQMAAKSAVPKRARLWALTLGFSLVVAVLALPRPGLGGSYVGAAWAGTAAVLAGISFAITFFHYFIDSQIFHFSDPITRKHIAPLLH